MRQLSKFAKALMIFIFSLISITSISQNPTYSCVATNDIQINANTYQFDVYIYRTGTTELYLNNYQLSFQITNSALILNGGTLSGSYVVGSTELPSAWTPAGVTVFGTTNPRKIRINGPPTSSNGTLIPVTGLRIGTFRITNSVPFGQASMGLIWWNATPAFTLIYAIVPPAATGPVVNITDMVSHTTSLTDPILNGAPAAYSVTGGGSYCQGGTGLPVGLAGSETGVTYTLYKNNIAQIPTVSGTGAAISFGNQLAGIYTVKGSNGTVTTDMTGTAEIIELPLPVPTISGISTVCEGTSGVVYTTEMGMSNYVWLVSPGGTVTSGGTSTSNTITITWSTAGSNSVSVNYTTGTCTAETATVFPVLVNPVPVTPVASVTAQPTCAVATGTITVTSPVPAAGITYSIDGLDYTNTSGIFTGVAPGTYSVTVRNAAGCVSAATSVTVIMPDGRPGIPGDFTEASTYMCAGNSATYTIPNDPFVSYVWNYSGEGATIKGTGNTVTISFSAIATSGILSVYAQNACGISDSRIIFITVRQLPGPAGIITGLTSICQGTKGVVYSVNEIPNAVHYIWTLPEGASIVGGNDTRTIVVDFSAKAVSGEITVQGSKLCGTGEVSPPLFVTVNEKPSSPVISLVDNVLHSNVLSGNQWYLDEKTIDGAEGNKYTPAISGKYFSIVTLDGCSSARSNVIDFTLPIKEKRELAIDIWPIPNRGNFTMTLESEDKETYNITVYNAGGVKLYEKKKVIVDKSAKIPFDLGTLPAGTYYIRISGPSGTFTRTIILSK